MKSEGLGDHSDLSTKKQLVPLFHLLSLLRVKPLFLMKMLTQKVSQEVFFLISFLRVQLFLYEFADLTKRFE